MSLSQLDLILASVKMLCASSEMESLLQWETSLHWYLEFELLSTNRLFYVDGLLP